MLVCVGLYAEALVQILTLPLHYCDILRLRGKTNTLAAGQTDTTPQPNNSGYRAIL